MTHTAPEQTTRITAGHVLAWNGTDHALLTDAEVVYRGTTILFVGDRWDGVADVEIDASGGLVMPGFIDLDALTDIDHCLLDSWQDRDVSGSYNWSTAYAKNPRHTFTQAQRALVREFAIAQLARHGVTTFMPIASEVHSQWAESYEDFRDVAQITQRIGLRGYLGPSYRSAVNVFDAGSPGLYWDEKRGEEGLDGAIEFLDHVQSLGSELISGALLPCRIETITQDVMARTASVARERDVPVRLHCLQSPREEPLLRERYSMGVLDSLEHTGLLDADLLIPHGMTLGDLRDPSVVQGPDVSRLVHHQVPIIHCPLTSARYGSALSTFEAYRDAGLPMVLGTDSFPPDLIRGIDVGVQLAKIMEGKLSGGRVESYIRAGTSDGADALGRPDLGRLAPGAQADLIVVDLTDFAMGVVDDPIRTMIVNGSGRDVVRTVVAGRTVMSDGVVHGTDVVELGRAAQALFEAMRQAYPGRDDRGRSADELFPPSFAPMPPS